MNDRLTILWIAVVAVTGTALVGSGRRALGGANHLAEASAAYLDVREQVEELYRLCAIAPQEYEPPTTAEELPARVSGVIRACGLPSSAMASFDAGGAARDGNAVTRRASLVLEQITLPQAGRFLSEWRLAEPQWVVASVDLSPRGQPPAAGGDLPLQAVISMESAVRATGDRP